MRGQRAKQHAEQRTTLPAYFSDGTFTPRATVDNRRVSLPGGVPASVAIPYFLHLALIYGQPGEPSFGFTDPAVAALDGGLGRILYTPAATMARPTP